MDRDYKGAARILGIAIFGAGGYVLAIQAHEFSGRVHTLLDGLSSALLLVAVFLAIAEGRARGRRERSGGKR